MHIKGLNILDQSHPRFAKGMVRKHILLPIEDLLDEYGFEFYCDCPASVIDGRWDSWDFRHEGYEMAVVVRWPHWLSYIAISLMAVDEEDEDSDGYSYWVRDCALAELEIYDTHQVHPCPRDWLKRELERRGFIKVLKTWTLQSPEDSDPTP